MKDQLIFDATELSSGDNVGAFVRSDDGTLITHHNLAGGDHLDVYAALADGSGTAITSTGGAIDVNIKTSDISINVDLTQADEVTVFQGTSPWVVSATDLDIRNLVFATDKVDVSGSEVSLDAATLAALETITVVATQLDIDDLNATDDAVSAWMKDGSGNSIGSTSNALDVYVTGSGPLTINDAALANTAIATAAETLDTANTAQNIKATAALANRKYLFVYNKDNKQMEIGPSGFSVGDGFPISPGSYMELRAGAAVDIEFNSVKLNHEIRTMELS